MIATTPRISRLWVPPSKEPKGDLISNALRFFPIITERSERFVEARLRFGRFNPKTNRYC